MTWSHRLFTFAVVVSLLNVLAALIAIIANWPAQFGGVGTDAGREFLVSGTAISAPALPAALLLIIVWRARAAGSAGWAGIVAAYLTAALVFFGGLGEAVADPTEDTPRAVLLVGGTAWVLVATVLVILATGAARERRRRGPKQKGT